MGAYDVLGDNGGWWWIRGWSCRLVVLSTAQLLAQNPKSLKVDDSVVLSVVCSCRSCWRSSSSCRFELPESVTPFFFSVVCLRSASTKSSSTLCNTRKPDFWELKLRLHWIRSWGYTFTRKTYEDAVPGMDGKALQIDTHAWSQSVKSFKGPIHPAADQYSDDEIEEWPRPNLQAFSGALGQGDSGLCQAGYARQRRSEESLGRL